MKKVSVNIMYDSEKLSAIKLYMSQRDMDIKDELEKSVDALYSKYVPTNVREFIDMKSTTTKQSKTKTEKSDSEENDSGGEQ